MRDQRDIPAQDVQAEIDRLYDALEAAEREVEQVTRDKGEAHRKLTELDDQLQAVLRTVDQEMNWRVEATIRAEAAEDKLAKLRREVRDARLRGQNVDPERIFRILDGEDEENEEAS